MMRSEKYPLDTFNEETETNVSRREMNLNKTLGFYNNFASLCGGIGSLITLVRWTKVASHHAVMLLFYGKKVSERTAVKISRNKRFLFFYINSEIKLIDIWEID